MLSWDCNWVICINNGSTTYSIKNVALVGSEWGNNNKTIPNIAPGKSAVIAAEGSFNYPYTQMYDTAFFQIPGYWNNSNWCIWVWAEADATGTHNWHHQIGFIPNPSIGNNPTRPKTTNFTKGVTSELYWRGRQETAVLNVFFWGDDFGPNPGEEEGQKIIPDA